TSCRPMMRQMSTGDPKQFWPGYKRSAITLRRMPRRSLWTSSSAARAIGRCNSCSNPSRHSCDHAAARHMPPSCDPHPRLAVLLGRIFLFENGKGLIFFLYANRISRSYNTTD
ncbi:hypothetical protein PFISCL1PPCAC_22791, partial [Pristionchus fissidentatus]